MTSTSRLTARAPLILLAGALLACADVPTQVAPPTEAQLGAVKFWEVTASTRWNRRCAIAWPLRTTGRSAISIG